MRNTAQQRAYMRAYIARVATMECPCSQPAVRFSCGGPVCQRCYDIEQMLEQERRSQLVREIDGPRRSHVGGLEEHSCQLPHYQP